MKLSRIGGLMPLSNTARLEAFARLIALGYPPVLAAKAAGYRNLRASRAATRLPQPPAVAGPNEPPTTPATATSAAAQTARPPLEPMMTEEEWLVAFHPRYRREAPASA